MDILQIILVFFGMLCVGIVLTVYTFYLFFMKNAPDAEEIEITEHTSLNSQRIAV